MIKLKPLGYYDYTLINNYTIQGFVYSFLKETAFYTLHDKKTFKF